jgi:hypothetical protein
LDNLSQTSLIWMNALRLLCLIHFDHPLFYNRQLCNHYHFEDFVLKFRLNLLFSIEISIIIRNLLHFISFHYQENLMDSILLVFDLKSLILLAFFYILFYLLIILQYEVSYLDWYHFLSSNQCQFKWFLYFYLTTVAHKFT